MRQTGSVFLKNLELQSEYKEKEQHQEKGENKNREDKRGIIVLGLVKGSNQEST